MGVDSRQNSTNCPQSSQSEGKKQMVKALSNRRGCILKQNAPGTVFASRTAEIIIGIIAAQAEKSRRNAIIGPASGVRYRSQ